MDWTQSYSVEWRVFEVNSETWADAGLVEGVVEAQVERDASSAAPLLESGSIKLTAPIGEQFNERYLRISMTAHQYGQAERVNVATLYFAQTNGDDNYAVDTQSLVGRSVLYPASVRKLTSGTYAPKGIDGAQWAADMLREAIVAPVEVEGAFTLDSNIVFNVGTTYLQAVWSILDAGNFCMQLSGDGVVHVRPLPNEASLILDDTNARLLLPSIKRDFDMTSVPNQYTAIEGNQTATATNDNINSQTSTIVRGYIHNMVDKSPKRVNGETLASYAARKLEEASRVPETRTYSREYYPDVLPFSLVKGSFESVGLEGSLRVKTQSLKCDRGITVTEKSERGVYTWQR